ncbi:PREDICTED: glutathione S-transferase 1, isoform D-like [Papilio polytes]|uniref:glutathione S-transferase 1, isoform D-like n=1 Tax=Papilio polytes TaxID=76194 RepID=UPI000675D52E|nr:PREDICTED: glutathione S-transferase 1, isoform D-like [Papilio polytes]
MAPIKLYYYPVSGPARIALMAARLIGVPIQLEIVDLMKKEQYSEVYLKINPQHCVPTLDDDGFILSESRAIACYLADKYGTDDTIYPKDLKKRAIVNQRLYFECSTLLVKMRAICHPILFNIETEIKKNLRDDFNASLSILEKYLTDSEWVAGEHVTIADTTIFASISGIFATGWDLSSFPNIQRWLNSCSNLPGYEEIKEGAKIYGDLVKKNLKQ